MNGEQTIFSVESDQDIIFVTVSKYKLLLSHGTIGLDAYVLYSHYMFTARLQESNIIKATRKYVKTGLSWGNDRFYKAKNLLIGLGLISEVERQNGYKYIQVRTKTVPFETADGVSVETGGVSPLGQGGCPINGQGGVSVETVNALTNNIKCLNKERGKTPSLEEWCEYCRSKGYAFNFENAWHHYEANGWRQSNGNKIKKWKSCAATCQGFHDKDKKHKPAKPFKDRNAYLEGVEQLVEEGLARIGPDGQIEYMCDIVKQKQIEG